LTVYSLNAQEILKKYWGHENFRPLQEEIINSVLQGNDTLALLPTGGGKSICFQVPALLKDGICIVISPLIALMKDQVENLIKRDIEAKAIYSGMDYREIDLTLDNCINNPEIKFLYLSPERLKNKTVRERIRQMKVNLFAVDEAHCISQWGFDFRPEYRQIAEIREMMPKVPVLALTATATRDVVDDIQAQLGFKKKNVFQKSFERKNLSYVVRICENKTDKMIEMFNKVKGSGLVYVRNRRKTEELARLLKSAKINADFYHAGMPYQKRVSKQDEWIKGKTRIMVCTNAFGMGIDKADCRMVIHYEIPDCPESYYQEAGRAGRDEAKAFCVLLYNHGDEAEMNERIAVNFPDDKEIKSIYQALSDYYQVPAGNNPDRYFDFDMADFCLRYNFRALTAFSCMKILEQCELIGLSEAFYEPSKIKFNFNNAELYKFQVENVFYDECIKLLLRSYGGMFDNYVSINETQLARQAKMSQAELKKILVKLHALEVLDYREQKDSARLNFTQTRINTENINLDKALLKQRKKKYTEKLHSMITYADNLSVCRSRVLLEYFNEFGANDCGVCDICIDKKKTQLKQEEYESISSLIKDHLKNPQTIFQMINADTFKNMNTDKFIGIVRILLDNNKLQVNKEKQLYWTGK